ncbi:Hypothetical protein FKW44_012327, partial [Caligus rogercresseyi]
EAIFRSREAYLAAAERSTGLISDDCKGSSEVIRFAIRALSLLGFDYHHRKILYILLSP